ncbi:Uncharacterised protein [Streptococcus pneumoniae]|nr:Uncharacterised protein [Streptococcus pneumoniae]
MRPTRLQRIISTVQYLLTYQSCTCEDDIIDQVRELLTHEDIEYRADILDDETYIIDIGNYLLN